MSENRFSCGPLTLGTETAILRALDVLGLRVSDDGSQPRCLPDLSGWIRLEARGDGVRGYLLAEDGEEAELQDVKRLVLMCCLPGREVTFSGSALVAKETLLVLTSRALHDGRVVKVVATRTVLGPAGRVCTLRDTFD